MSAGQNPHGLLNDAIMKEISRAVGSLKYGSVTVKVHDSKVVQIEVAQRKRFDNLGRVEEGGGI